MTYHHVPTLKHTLAVWVYVLGDYISVMFSVIYISRWRPGTLNRVTSVVTSLYLTLNISPMSVRVPLHLSHVGESDQWG